MTVKALSYDVIKDSLPLNSSILKKDTKTPLNRILAGNMERLKASRSITMLDLKLFDIALCISIVFTDYIYTNVLVF